MSKRRGGSRSRIHARDQKYTMGYDPGVPGDDQTILFSHDEQGARILKYIRPVSTEELHDTINRLFGRPVVIEGEYRVIETDETRLLDAGGSES